MAASRAPMRRRTPRPALLTSGEGMVRTSFHDFASFPRWAAVRCWETGPREGFRPGTGTRIGRNVETPAPDSRALRNRLEGGAFGEARYRSRTLVDGRSQEDIPRKRPFLDMGIHGLLARPVPPQGPRNCLAFAGRQAHMGPISREMEGSDETTARVQEVRILAPPSRMWSKSTGSAFRVVDFDRGTETSRTRSAGGPNGC